MTDRDEEEYVRALWQSDASQVGRLSLDDVRDRAEYLRRQFNGTRWVPWVTSGFLVAFFALMWFVAAPLAVNRVGAVLGFLGGLVPAGYMVTRHQRRAAAGASAAVACARAYEAQLARQGATLNATAITLVLMMLGAGLLAVPADAGLGEAVAAAGTPALVGLGTAWWVRRQAKRYARCLEEVRRLSA